MKVLLDTNIIIHREASKVRNQDIGVLFGWLDKLHHTKCIHKVTLAELERHLDKDTVQTMQIKLQNYTLLQTEAPLHDTVKQVSTKIDVTSNDFDDTRILNEVFSDRVDCLITEDKKIHAKAELLGIADKVFRIETYLEKVIAENPSFVDYQVLSVRKQFFGNIPIEDPFFDSFRQDYIGFEKWFSSKAGSNEQAYVCFEDNSISAFLYLKVESETERYDDISPFFEPRKRLKIGTFKVTNNGLRIGERFLKIIFDNARLYKVEQIYVTIFDKRPEAQSLIALLESFGFVIHGTKRSPSGIERVYIRDLLAPADPQNPKSTFPKLSQSANVYIVPIQPKYHTELFPDSYLRTESPTDFVENEPHRNSISKSYISHSGNRKLKCGDIMVFYRSGGSKYKGVVTTIGIVEDVKKQISNFAEMVAICRRRTVLSEEELSQYWNRYPTYRPFVIDFLYAYSLKKKMNLNDMLKFAILPSMDSVRTITEMGKEQFIRLLKMTGV